jgi:hypothetical protein
MASSKRHTLARACTAIGTLVATAALGWLIAEGDGSRVLFGLLVAAGVLLVLGVGILLTERKLEEFADRDAKGLVAVAAVGLMLAVGAKADPGTGKLADRILIWAFVVFAVGLSELFVLFVVSAIRGRIDLTRVFLDKLVDVPPAQASEAPISAPALPPAGSSSAIEPADPGAEKQPPPPRAHPSGGGEDSKPTVSLSRLQAFAWTLVVMIVYFHRVVTNETGELPAIPPELLMVMGISGAVYLTSKEMGNRAQLEAQKRSEG